MVLIGKDSQEIGRVRNLIWKIIVVDFGSATTYDVINEGGAFIGGAIAPGIDVSAHHLIEKTALLRSAAFQFPKTVVGKNTESNLHSTLNVITSLTTFRVVMFCSTWRSIDLSTVICMLLQELLRTHIS